jgi:hypothetical protein
MEQNAAWPFVVHGSLLMAIFAAFGAIVRYAGMDIGNIS